ncbi:MAG TPA: permease prefix domain 1-containing protein, partial [Candidatus Aquilonibacter sp.]|nr:permease prefix domain 1-containing protein [Candidatus Aquilonibacter sp.]
LNLASEDRRELETHLRDAIAGFQQRGLNDEESFWLARERIGQLRQLGEEFVKANPTAVWRERVFWMTISLVGSYIFMTWKDLLATWLVWTQLFYLIPLFVLIGAVIMIRRGRVPNPNHFENIAAWKCAGGLFAILTATVLTAFFRGRHLPANNIFLPANDMFNAGYNLRLWLSWLGNAIWPTVMVLVLLLTLKRNRKTHKIV